MRQQTRPLPVLRRGLADARRAVRWQQGKGCPLDKTRNFGSDANFVGFNNTLAAEVCATPTERNGYGGVFPLVFSKGMVQDWCSYCFANGTVNAYTYNVHFNKNVDAITGTDWLALAFVCFVAAFTVVAELKDVQLCAIAVERAGERLSFGWRLAMRLLGGARRWVFLPSLICTMPALAVNKGGDALSVCFNTIALLFMCEIDNLAYSQGLSERVRSRVEEAGRVELDDEDVSALTRTKVVHVVMIVVVVFTAVAWPNGTSPLKPLILWWMGAAVEALIEPGASAPNRCKGVATALAKWVAGFVVFMALWTFAFGAAAGNYKDMDVGGGVGGMVGAENTGS